MRLSAISYQLSALILTALFLSDLPVSAGANTEEADFAALKSTFNTGLYERSEEMAESFLDRYPRTEHLYDAHLLLGRSLYYQNYPTRARHELELVLNASEGYRFQDDALYWLGGVYFRMGDFKKALEYYQKIIDDFPSSRYLGCAHYSKGWSYFELGFFDEAIASFREVVAHFPLEETAIGSQFKLGECEYLMERYDRAITELDIFIEKFPVSEKIALVYYLKGEALFCLEMYDDSIAYFNKAIAIAGSRPWCELALYRTASAYLALGKYDSSMAGYKRCIESTKNDSLKAGSMFGLARNYQFLDMPSDASKICDEILAKYPHSAAATDASYTKIKMLYEDERYGEALDITRSALEKFPGQAYGAYFRYILSVMLIKEGRLEEAKTELLRLTHQSEAPDIRPLALCRLGDISAAGKGYKAAVEFFDTVLARYPDSSQADYAQYQIGNIFLTTSNYRQAILAYKSALVNFPNSLFKDEINSHLAVACFKNGDFEEAISGLKHLTKSMPDSPLNEVYNFYLASSLSALSRYEEAAAIFTAVEKEATAENIRMMARYGLAWCYYNTHDGTRALAEFTRLLNDHPSSEITDDIKYWLGEYYQLKGEQGKAMEYFSSIVTDIQAPLDPMLEKNTYRKMAMVEKATKDFDHAIQHFKKTLTNENSDYNAQVQYELAEVFEAKGAVSEAIDEYSKVWMVYQKGVYWAIRAQLKCAQLFERIKKTDEAKALYEKLAAMDVEESKYAKEQLLKYERRNTNDKRRNSEFKGG